MEIKRKRYDFLAAGHETIKYRCIFNLVTILIELNIERDSEKKASAATIKQHFIFYHFKSNV